MTAYYNEIDPFAAGWLRELIKAKMIAPGEVDTRSIEDVVPTELDGFTQCHFFAGIGVWSYSLRCAGWPDDRPIWTGSCPCQPFSAAGKGKGIADERHLWPAFFHLIDNCHPVAVIGEQVASKDGLGWLDLVQVDMEGAGYACRAVDTCAAGFGAPHLRQRLYWMADTEGGGWGEEQQNPRRLREGTCPTKGDEPGGSFAGGSIGELGRPEHDGCSGQEAEASESCGDGESNGIIDGSNNGLCNSATGPTNGHWRDVDWLLCRDGRWRPTQPEIFPLAHGITNRVGMLRGAGNAIVAPQATEFIRAVMEVWE